MNHPRVPPLDSQSHASHSGLSVAGSSSSGMYHPPSCAADNATHKQPPPRQVVSLHRDHAHQPTTLGIVVVVVEARLPRHSTAVAEPLHRKQHPMHQPPRALALPPPGHCLTSSPSAWKLGEIETRPLMQEEAGLALLRPHAFDGPEKFHFVPPGQASYQVSDQPVETRSSSVVVLHPATDDGGGGAVGELGREIILAPRGSLSRISFSWPADQTPIAPDADLPRLYHQSTPNESLRSHVSLIKLRLAEIDVLVLGTSV